MVWKQWNISFGYWILVVRVVNALYFFCKSSSKMNPKLPNNKTIRIAKGSNNNDISSWIVLQIVKNTSWLSICKDKSDGGTNDDDDDDEEEEEEEDEEEEEEEEEEKEEDEEDWLQ